MAACPSVLSTSPHKHHPPTRPSPQLDELIRRCIYQPRHEHHHGPPERLLAGPVNATDLVPEGAAAPAALVAAVAAAAPPDGGGSAVVADETAIQLRSSPSYYREPVPDEWPQDEETTEDDIAEQRLQHRVSPPRAPIAPQYTCCCCQELSQSAPAAFCASCASASEEASPEDASAPPGGGVAESSAAICDACLVRHSRMPVFARHRPAVNDARVETLQLFGRAPGPTACPRHRLQLDFRCMSCSGLPLLCPQCFVGHADHRWVRISELAATEATSILREMAAGPDGRSPCETTAAAHADAADAERAAIPADAEAAAQLIESLEAALISAVRERCAALHGAVQTAASRLDERLGAELAEADSARAEAEAARVAALRALSVLRPVDIAEHGGAVVARLHAAREAVGRLPEARPARIVVTGADPGPLAAAIAALGAVEEELRR